MDFIADRLKNIPTYLFMHQRSKIKRIEATGADCISLSIDDPDKPTPVYIIETLRDLGKHLYPECYIDLPSTN